MACNVINSWTFTGLVGAFLDLFIAYSLLCGSTLAYLASKFMGLFGQSLPCPCNGLFGYPHKYSCFQAMLVNNPPLKISNVQSSVKNKLPFDSIWSKFHDEDDDEYHDSYSHFEKCQNGNVEMGGEGSSGSCKSKKNFIGEKKGSFEPVSKWKGFGNQRPRVGLKWRKRVANGHDGKVFSFSHDPLASVATPTGLKASATVDKLGNYITEDGRETLKEIRLPKRGSLDFDVDDDPFTENKPIEEELALAEFKCLTPDPNFDGSDRNEIRVLQQALDKEHAARTALHTELEKERIAAATAADEAMAMILHLQEEKAAIEMEARQYQRMIEEKIAYDAEEMNILKEILLRREREKHFLEKEVEAYKQMFFENEPLDTDMYNMVATQEQRTSNDRQQLMLKRITESVGEKENTKNNSDFSEYEMTSVGSPHDPLDFGKELPVPELNEDASSLNSSIEKNHAHLSRSDYQSTTPLRSDLPEKAIKPMVEEEQCSETSPHQCLTPRTTEAKIIFPYNNKKMEKYGGDLHGSDSGIDYHLFDVHVINDESDLNKEEHENKSEKKSISVTSNFPRTFNNPTIGGLEIEPYRKRNSLDRFGGLPSISPLRVKSLPPISRRNSMSAFDYERLKIDNEVGWLRERLKVVQQGRDKLNFPARHKEKEQVQLQILENIASQLREIRQLTEHGKAFRQASLPHPSSKVMSKKRYQQGAPLGVLRSI